MLAEFRPPDDPELVLATVKWQGAHVEVTCDDDGLKTKLVAAYRPVPVVTDDSSYRRLGTSGAVVIQPGDLEWFRAVSQVRAPAQTGLSVRLVPGITEGGFDPASGYRTFEESVEGLDRSG